MSDYLTPGGLALALLALVAGPAWAGPLPDAARERGLRVADWKKLEAGETVVRVEESASGTPGKVAVGFVLIRAGWEQVFDVVSDRERHPEYSSCLKSLVVLSRDEEDDVKKIKVREKHESMRFKRRYTVDYEDDFEGKEIRWSLDKTAKNDVQELEGSWRFVPLDESATLVEARMSGTGGSMPRFIEEQMSKVGLAKSLAETKARVEATP